MLIGYYEQGIPKKLQKTKILEKKNTFTNELKMDIIINDNINPIINILEMAIRDNNTFDKKIHITSVTFFIFVYKNC